MLAMLEWASDRPDKWHKIGNLDATKKAAELLAPTRCD
jgi:soluble cytochrome b562